MIVGELIGVIASIVIWTLFIIGIFGLNKEFGRGYMDERPGWITLFVVFTVFGFAFGIMALVWLFITTGWDDILGNIFIGAWNTVI